MPTRTARRRSAPEGPISHYLCIGCPLGCRLEVEEDEGGTVVEVRGWSCKKGDTYGRQEHTDPRRMVATTARISGAAWARLPVKTTAPVPKDRVLDVCRLVHALRVTAPVRLGDVIVPDVLGSGADIVATRDMESLEGDGRPGRPTAPATV